MSETYIYLIYLGSQLELATETRCELTLSRREFWLAMIDIHPQLNQFEAGENLMTIYFR